MLDELLPPQVRVAEAFDDTAPAPLYAAEAALLTGSADRRRREFATVRACARRALGGLGHPPTPVLPGKGGAPRWPDGVVGSMTHCAGYRGAALAGADDLLTVGIDAEPAGPLPTGVLGLISSPAERAHLAELAAEVPEMHWDRLLFCAKEAVYKAWFPLTEQWLGFADAAVEINVDGTFSARLLGEPAHLAGRTIDGFAGRWLSRDGLTITAIGVPAREPDRSYLALDAIARHSSSSMA